MPSTGSELVLDKGDERERNVIDGVANGGS